ncbi:hypothetical protein GOY13_02695 [Wolbachia endosymbiont of Cruorifilaria tuberocauda]|uniref:hypothetical protein n=1 Tax=Wolbachia endosymbiont of Cruorifilaria tuberocauda TaxID=1812111 RepID=UPI00158D27F8|nr:hypothetical protein [Wolbachia endosymbiont of Cruorifilaria tuberocauda]QKX01822.1 hypothetical protein GOY13_02695 [Wolbachia endosymbiont of Cruorifilaria tuberocauda]
MAESIWNKIRKTIKEGMEITKNISILLIKALIHHIKKPRTSIGEIQYDAKVPLRKSAGIDISGEEKVYAIPIEAAEASKNFGVQITKHEKGLIVSLALRSLAGIKFYLTEMQLNKIEQLNNRYLSIHIDKGNDTIIIIVDVAGIIKDIKSNSKYKRRGKEEVKQLIISKIHSEVDHNLKDIAKIIGVEFVTHSERKFLHSIEEILYQEGDKWLSETVSSINTKRLPRQLSEIITNVDFNITNPNNFPYREKAIFPIKLGGNTRKQAKELEIKGSFSNLDSISSSKAIKPSFTSNKERGGKSRS